MSKYAIIGFLIGAGVGAWYGFRVGKSAESHVQTAVNDGKVSVTFDAKGALGSGLPKLIQGFL